MFKYQFSLKSVHWDPSCSLWMDGRTDTANLIVAFRNISKAPKAALSIPAMQQIPYTNALSSYPDYTSESLRNISQGLTM
jgi:hypothetical protein